MIDAVISENPIDTDSTEIKYILYLATINTYFSVSISQNAAIILISTTVNKVTTNPDIAFFISSLLNAICDAVQIANTKNSQKLRDPIFPLLNISVYTITIEFPDHFIRLMTVLLSKGAATTYRCNALNILGSSRYMKNNRAAVPLKSGPKLIKKFPLA